MKQKLIPRRRCSSTKSILHMPDAQTNSHSGTRESPYFPK
jgi:hypothetical protein